MADTGDLIKRIYGGFRGADFRGEEVNLLRSPDCLNVWKDYKETESIRTRPGMELNTEFEDTVYGIFFYKKALKPKNIIIASTIVYLIPNLLLMPLWDSIFYKFFLNKPEYTYWLSFTGKLMTYPILYAIQVVVLLLLFKYLKNFIYKNRH